MNLGDVAQLNTHVTDIEEGFRAEAADLLEREFAAADVSPPGVLSQVVRLGHPDLLVEIDAIAFDEPSHVADRSHESASRPARHTTRPLRRTYP
jgi:hypothetical protein